MKVIGSTHDIVEWNPHPVAPGFYFFKPSKIKKIKIGKKKKIILRSPCRIDVQTLDYTALKFTESENNYKKAGELSFAGNLYTTVQVKLIDKDEIIIESERPLLVKHYALIIKNATNYRGGLEIKTKQHSYQHIGLGSSSIMAETVASTINKLLGNPFSFKELKKIVIHNFVEESDSDKNMLFPGAATGGSFNTITYGGFVITSAEIEKIFRVSVDKNMNLIVGTPKLQTKGPEESEIDVNCMSWARKNSRFNAGKNAFWILTEVMPYMTQKNYKKAGEAFYDLNLFSSKALQMLFYQSSLADTLFQLKVAGIEGGWMTSAGPSLVAFTKDKTETALKIFKERHFQTVEIKPDNKGMVELKNF